jgi:hypothetical protein
MNNSDMPAMPVSDDMRYDTIYSGLTKLEQFCLTMGVADTGDAELDAIITKGNRQSLAGLVMPSLLLVSADARDSELALNAIEYTAVLLKALEKEDE